MGFVDFRKPVDEVSGPFSHRNYVDVLAFQKVEPLQGGGNRRPVVYGSPERLETRTHLGVL